MFSQIQQERERTGGGGPEFVFSKGWDPTVF